MADTLIASLDIDTGFASSNVKRFTPRAFATAERVWVKAGEMIFSHRHFIATRWIPQLRNKSQNKKSVMVRKLIRNKSTLSRTK